MKTPFLKPVIFFFLLFMIHGQSSAQMFWNQACSFAGTSSSYISARNTSTTNITGSFTIEAWINPNTVSSNSKGIIAKGGPLGTFMEYGLRIQPGGRLLLATGGTTRLMSKVSTTIPINQWTHVAATYNSSTNVFALHVNDVTDTTSTIAGAAPPFNTDSLFIGISGSTTPFSGLMDEIRIWNRAVTIIDVIRNMRVSLGTNSGYYYNGLILSMTFQKENSGGVQFTAQDWTGSGNYGTKVGVSQVNLSDLPSKTIATNLCLDFSFNNDYMAGADNAAVSPTAGITLQAWIYPRANFDRSLIHKGPPGGGAGTNYSLNIINQKLAAKINGGIFTSQDTLPLNQWSHVAFNYYYDDLFKYHSFYVNGSRVSWGRSFGGSSVTDGQDSLYIGGTNLLTSFYGYIDEVRISGFSKSQQEINDSMFMPMENGNVTPSSTVAYDFDGYSSCNTLIGPFLYFRNSPAFANPSVYSGYPVSPLNKAYSLYFQKGFHLTNGGRRIPSAGGSGSMINDSLNVFLDETISDINVYVALNHEKISELQVSLIAPNGNTVQLMNSNTLLANGKHVITVFDDQAALPLTNNTFISFSPAIRGLNNLNSALSGTSSKGVWRLVINDVTGADTGRLYAWGVQINNKYTLPYLISSKSFIQGFYSPGTNLMVRDTMKCYLRFNYSPYIIADSAKAYLQPDGSGQFTFGGQQYVFTGTPYCLQMIHRNALETWSDLNGTSMDILTLQGSYDFTPDSTKAFGNNMKRVDNAPVRYAFYSGDVNKDANIDAADIVAIFNDVNNFVSGYVPTDVTGDNFTDASDLIITYNNSINFVSVIRP